MHTKFPTFRQVDFIEAFRIFCHYIKNLIWKVTILLYPRANCLISNVMCKEIYKTEKLNDTRQILKLKLKISFCTLCKGKRTMNLKSDHTKSALHLQINATIQIRIYSYEDIVFSTKDIASFVI